MSLRLRLLVGLAVLVLGGLIVFGAGTYLSLDHFLRGRLDQQLTTAAQSIAQSQRPQGDGLHHGGGLPSGGSTSTTLPLEPGGGGPTGPDGVDDNLIHNLVRPRPLRRGARRRRRNRAHHPGAHHHGRGRAQALHRGPHGCAPDHRCQGDRQQRREGWQRRAGGGRSTAQRRSGGRGGHAAPGHPDPAPAAPHRGRRRRHGDPGDDRARRRPRPHGHQAARGHRRGRRRDQCR